MNFSTYASGPKTGAGWDPSTARSTSWSLSSRTAKARIATTSNWASTEGTAPTSGNTPALTLFRKQGDEGNLLALHPTVKPIALVADALLDSSARGQIVLDVFLGSGTTLMAAERIGRVCHGIELDPLYVDTAVRRWQRYTGDTAVHCETGETFNELEVKRG